MIPIGIVTYNRAEYLDVTLRSLSACQLPADQEVVVFDDASNDARTREYLYTDHRVDLSVNWPSNRHWTDAGLSLVRSQTAARGLKGRVPVISLGPTPRRVVNGSCQALQRLYERYPGHQEVILLQDDVVFMADWLQRIMAAWSGHKGRPPIGLIAGMRLNRVNNGTGALCHIPGGGVTAQCYFITAEGKKATTGYIRYKHDYHKGFDNKFCATVRSHGAGVYLMNPPVCQHIGVTSQVRPGWRWTKNGPRGRVDRYAKGPFVLAAEVRRFPAKEEPCLPSSSPAATTPSMPDTSSSSALPEPTGPA